MKLVLHSAEFLITERIQGHLEACRSSEFESEHTNAIGTFSNAGDYHHP